MTRLWGVIVQAEFFSPISQVKQSSWIISPTTFTMCSARTAGSVPSGGERIPDLGGKFYAVRVNCLDGVDVDELVDVPITYFDGANDNLRFAARRDPASLEQVADIAAMSPSPGLSFEPHHFENAPSRGPVQSPPVGDNGATTTTLGAFPTGEKC